MMNIAAKAVRTQLSDLLVRIYKGERFTITKNGKPAAALVSVEDLARLDRGDSKQRKARHA